MEIPHFGMGLTILFIIPTHSDCTELLETLAEADRLTGLAVSMWGSPSAFLHHTLYFTQKK